MANSYFCWMKFAMSDSHSNRKQAGVYINASDIDVTDAALDPGLSKVWTDEATGEIVVSVERVLFDSLLDISARYLEPHGYSLNLENLLATIDSMRMGVFANTTSKPGSDGRSIAKKLIPVLEELGTNPKDIAIFKRWVKNSTK